MAFTPVRVLRAILGLTDVLDVQQITFVNGTLASDGVGGVTYTAPTGGSGGTPAAHAASHATGGTDAVTAASIGAAATSHTHAANTLTGTALATSVVSSSLTSASGGTFGTAAFTAASAYATLDGAGKLTPSQLPDLAISDYLGSVASQVAMLALAGQRGDWCVRSDLGTNFVLNADTPTIIASWTQLTYPASPVTSVAGRTGAITLSNTDVSGLGTLATQNGTFTGTHSGTSSGTNTGDQTTIAQLTTPRNINGVPFDGTVAITIAAAAGTLTGTVLAAAVVSSSLTSAAGGVFGTAAFTAASAYATAAHTHTFASLTSIPTTLAGHGITDGQPLDSDLTAIAALTTTTFGRSLLTPIDAPAARAILGVGTGTGDALVANPLSQFAATTSAQLAGVISDETGTGQLVFATSPTLVTPIIGVATATSVNGLTLTTGTGTLTLSTFTLAVTAAASIAGTHTGTHSGTSSGVNTGDQTTIAQLTTPRNINGVPFDGTAAITVTAAAGTLTGTTLNATVVSSSLTSASGGTFGTAAFTAASAYATAAQGVTTLTLNTGGVIHATPVTFTNTAGAWSATQTLNTQVANSVFGNFTAGAATPTFSAAPTFSGANLTGTAAGLTAGTVTTNANLTGDVTSVGNATTLTNAPVIAKVLTGYVSGAGVLSATDSILAAIQKLNGNDATNANLTGGVTSVGNAATVVTNANLTGPVTSAGNATTIANAVVTYANIQNVSATARILGRKTAAAGVAEECTLSDILDFVASVARGDILLRGATTWGRLPISVFGKVATSNGTDLGYADPAGDLFTATDGATVTFDLTSSRRQIVTLGGNRTLALSNDRDGQAFTILLKQDATGTRTVTFWSGIKWPGGTVPTLTTTAGKYDVFAFLRIASGEYLGFTPSQNH